MITVSSGNNNDELSLDMREPLFMSACSLMSADISPSNETASFENTLLKCVHRHQPPQKNHKKEVDIWTSSYCHIQKPRMPN